MNYLEAEDLTTGYGRQVISEALNCSFEAGTITSIIGPNGCGKSTLLKTLARILPTEKGKVFIKNQELQHFSSKEVAQELAILSQTPENTIDLSVLTSSLSGGIHINRAGKVSPQKIKSTYNGH